MKTFLIICLELDKLVAISFFCLLDLTLWIISDFVPMLYQASTEHIELSCIHTCGCFLDLAMKEKTN